MKNFQNFFLVLISLCLFNCGASHPAKSSQIKQRKASESLQIKKKSDQKRQRRSSSQDSSDNFIPGSDQKVNSYYSLLMALQSQQKGNKNLAQKFLNQAVEADDSSSYLWAQKAYFDAGQSDWDTAVADAEKSLSHDPNNAETLLLLGKLLAARNQPEKAIPYYSRVLKMNPSNEEAATVMARELTTLNRNNEAIQTLKRCMAVNPESLNCSFYLASIYEKLEKNTEAIQIYEQIDESHPENPRVLQLLGNLYLKKQNLPKALEVYKQINRLVPTDIPSQIKTAIIHYELHQIDEAIAGFEMVLKHHSVSDRMYYFLGMLYFEKKDFEKGMSYLKNIKPNSTYYVESIVRQALALKISGKLDRAISFLKSKISGAGNKPQVYDLLTTFYLVAKRDREALTVLDKAVQNFPQNVDLLFRRGVILDRLGRWKESEEFFLEVLKNNPNEARVLNYLGYTYVDHNQNMDQARDFLLKAVSLKPKDGYILDSLGWYYFKTGNVAKALQVILRANVLAPNEPAILEHLGDIYVALKQVLQARKYYEAALKEINKTPDRDLYEEQILQRIQDKMGKFN